MTDVSVVLPIYRFTDLSLLLAWLSYQQGRWARIASQGTWNVERDQARQHLRLGTVVAALLCLALGVVTLLSLWQN